MKNIVDAKYIPVLRVSRRMPSLSGEVVSFLDSLLQRNPTRRLGAVVPDTGKVNARDHPWFSSIDWMAVMRRELDPGYVPKVSSNEDVSNFDDVFTKETAELSGEDILSKRVIDTNVMENNEEIRNKLTWMNLWGLVGKESNEDIEVIPPDDDSLQTPSDKEMENESASDAKDISQSDVDAFEGFSFDAPSPLAMSIADTYGQANSDK